MVNKIKGKEHPFLLNLAGKTSKMAFLAHVRQYSHLIFHEDEIYPIDPLKILEENLKLRNILKKLPSFSHLLRIRGPLRNYLIKQKGKSRITSFQLSPEAFKAFRDNLKNRLKELNSGGPDRHLLLGRIRELGDSSSPLSAKSLPLLRDLIKIFILVQHEGGDIPQDLRDIRKALGRIKEAQLDYFTDQVTLERKMAPLRTILGKRRILQIKKAIRKNLKGLLSHTKATQKWISVGVCLKECPPFLAIYRGCLGHDCSSQYSSGYALSPAEMIFTIYQNIHSSEGKGYVAGTKVKVDGKVCLYLHTIAGPHVTGAQAELILQGLYLKRKDLGVEMIVLPTRAQQENFLNFLDIKRTFRNLVKGERGHRIEYLDTVIRKKIGKFVPADITYDEPGSNQKGHLYHPSSRDLQKIRVSNKS